MLYCCYMAIYAEILLPLYKLDFLSFFLSQLKDVVRTFCKKDASLHKPVAREPRASEE